MPAHAQGRTIYYYIAHLSDFIIFIHFYNFRYGAVHASQADVGLCLRAKDEKPADRTHAHLGASDRNETVYARHTIRCIAPMAG